MFSTRVSLWFPASVWFACVPSTIAVLMVISSITGFNIAGFAASPDLCLTLIPLNGAGSSNSFAPAAVNPASFMIAAKASEGTALTNTITLPGSLCRAISVIRAYRRLG